MSKNPSSPRRPSPRKPALGEPNVYGRIILRIFTHHHAPGARSFDFERTEIEKVAAELGVPLPKNLGDVIYSFRYRNPLPEEILKTAAPGFEWVIEGGGVGRYTMRQVKVNRIVPREGQAAVKIPDSTPEIIAAHAQGDEQALLAKVRYNRLIDIFLGIAAFSLQNHVRTTVKGVGQIEIDELYVAVDRAGVQYVVPVQAKVGSDQHGAVQTLQDIACCAAKFPHLVCRAVSAQLVEPNLVALFELTVEDQEVKVVQERHYRLVESSAITAEDLRAYRSRSTST